MVTVLEPPVKRWHCPRCGAIDATREVRPHTQMHTCPALGMLTAPMLEEGMAGDVVAVVREDYLGTDLQTTDESGRPISSIVRVRDDGQDVWAQAGCAQIKITNL
jgi:hypothetical protein